MSIDLGDTPNQWIAPDGMLWVCFCCGRYGKDRTKVGDSACFSNSYLAYSESIVAEDGRAVKCKWADEGE